MFALIIRSADGQFAFIMGATSIFQNLSFRYTRRLLN